ncbi:MAG: response regulator [Anaerolineae bacterium]|nr:response regulator [Anaerolineae bacterium]
MTGQRHKILIVDDLPDWRQTLKGLLADEGYEIEVADSLSGALSLLSSDQFDLIVSDLRLDESDTKNKDGLELASRVRAQWPGTKVILITGYGTQEVVDRAMIPDSQGSLVANYIPKTETDKLPQMVLEMLGR